MSTEPRPFASTLRFEDERYLRRCRPIEPPPDLPNGQYDVIGELKALWRILRRAVPGEVLLVYSTRGALKPELLAAILMRLLPKKRRSPVVVYGDMWQPSSGARRLIERAALRLADPGIARYVCGSRADAETVQELWPISRDKVTVVPMFLETRGTTPCAVSPGPSYVFAGGDSGRDFGPVLELARLRPEVPFVLNTTRVSADAALAPNVELRSERFDGFARLMGGATVVIVPLRTDVRRDVGTFSVLLAAWLMKPIIVPPVAGVKEYLTHGEHALFVDGSVEQYRAALDSVLDPANAAEVDAMVQRAHEHVTSHYTLERHIDGLLRVIDEVAEQERATSPTT